MPFALRLGLGLRAGRRPGTPGVPRTLHVFDPEVSAFTAARPGGVSLDDDSYLYRLAPLQPTFPFTLAFWFRESAGATASIAGQYSGRECGNYVYLSGGTIAVYSDHRPGGVYAASGEGTTQPYATGQWHSVVAVWESTSSRKLSVDGGAFAEDTTLIDSQTSMDGTTLNGFGTHGVGGGTSDSIAIEFAAVRTWGRALSQEEAATFHAGGTIDGGPDHRYDFAERRGPRLDSVGSADLSVSGSPDAIIGPGGTLEDSGYAWDGDIVHSVGDFTAAGPDAVPTARTHPRQLELSGSLPGPTRTGKSVAGRATWTHAARLHFTVGDAAFAYEANTAADGSWLDLGIDGQGRPFVAASGPGGAGEVVVTCPVPAFGTFAVVGGSTEGDAASKGRTRCMLTLDGLGGMAVGDYVAVSGCGAPFDGEHVLSRCRINTSTGDKEIEYYVYDMPWESSTTPTAGDIVPTGLIQYGWNHALGPDDSRFPGYEVRPCQLRVEREADAVRWYVDGVLLGTADASALPLGGDESGNATVSLGRPADGRRDGPSVLPTYLASYPRILSTDEALSVDVRLACRVTGGFDYAEHPCFVDCESLPGLGRRQSAQGLVLQIWTDDATGQVVGNGEVDDRTGDRRGIARSDFSAEHLGTFDQAGETTYSLSLAYRLPRYSELGEAQSPEWAYAGKVLTARRLPYAASDTVTVAASGGDHATIQAAVDDAAPGRLILVNRGETFDYFGITPGKGPFCIAAAPGAGARPTVNQYYDAGTESPGTVLQLDPGLSHAAVVGLHLDQQVGGSVQGGGHAVHHSLANRGLATRDLLLTAANGGHGLNSDVILFVSHADWQMTGGVREGYVVILENGTRWASFRRLVLDRGAGGDVDAGTGYHLWRTGPCDVVHVAGISSRPPEGHFPNAAFTPRYGSRRNAYDGIDIGDMAFVYYPADGAPGGQQAGQVDPRRNRLVGVACRSIDIYAPSGVYAADCYTMGGGLTVTSDSVDAADRYGDTTVLEGNACRGSGAPAVPGPDPIGFPSTGPWANTNPTDDVTGETLSAPGVSAVAIPGTRLVIVAADGVAQGGTLPHWLTLQADESAAPGRLGMGTAVVLDPGSHTLLAVAHDDAGATASGTPATLP